jgi:hypothetical protein
LSKDNGINLEKMANVVTWTLVGWVDAAIAAYRVRHEPVDMQRLFAEADE